MNPIDKHRSAVVLMDLQGPIVGMLGDAATPILESTKLLITAARQANIPVIYVVLGFRPGIPEMSPHNPMSATVTRMAPVLTGVPGADIPEAIRPEPGEIVVVKHRVGAFSGSDLEMILRAKGIQTLILGGVATSGIVLSTVRLAADLDFQMIIAKDCCADRDEEVHRVLFEKVLARQATIATASEIAAAMQ